VDLGETEWTFTTVVTNVYIMNLITFLILYKTIFADLTMCNA